MHRRISCFKTFVRVALGMLLFMGHVLNAQTGAQAVSSMAQVEGARLEFTPHECGKEKSSEQEELQLLLRLTARLTSEKPLTVRREKLPPGTYDVLVERDGDKSFWLVIQTKPGPESATSNASTQKYAKKESGSQEEVAPPALEEKATEAEKVAPAPRHAGKESGTDNKSQQKSSSEPRASRSKVNLQRNEPPGEEAQPQVTRLKVPLSMRTCERKGNLAHFGLSARSKGTRLRFTLRAGGTEAWASVKFGESR